MSPRTDHFRATNGRTGVVASGLGVLFFLTVPGTVVAQVPDAASGEEADTIVINAPPLPVETLVDRKVYQVSADLQSTTGTAADILANIPSVEVDADGIVALRGDTGVLVLVDGRPVAQLSGPLAGQSLQQMPAQDIERIEIMSNPPAEYKAEGAAGVINIITRKSRRAGFSGSANASAGNDNRYVAGASASYKAGDWSASASANLRQDDRVRHIDSNLVAPDPQGGGLAASSQFIDEHVRRHIPVLKASAQYDINARQTIDMAVTRGGRSGRRSLDQIDASAATGTNPATLSERIGIGREWSDDIDTRVSFGQKLARPDETVTLTLHQTRFHEREHYNYTNVDRLSAAAPTYDNLNLSEDQSGREATVDYVLPLAEGRRLKLGYDVEGDDNRYGNAGDNFDPASGAFVPNAATTNNFQYLQQTNAAYGSYQAASGAWNWLGGLRVEATRGDARLLSSGQITGRAYAGAYPSVHVERALSETQTLFFGASRRLKRPDAGALDPYVNRQDTHNLRAGNPNLLPQDTRSVEAGYSVETRESSYALTAYLRRSLDSVTDLTQVISANVVEVTKANLPRSDSAGIELTANGPLGARLRYGLSGNLFYSQIDATALGATGLASTTGLNAKANIDYRYSAADWLQIAITRSDKRLTPQGYIGAVNRVNLGYRRRVSANLAMVATVADFFNGQTLTRVADSPGLNDTYQRHTNGHIAFLGLVYSFGSDKVGRQGFDFAP